MFFQKKFFFREKNFLYIFLRKTTLRKVLIFYQKVQFFLYFEKYNVPGPSFKNFRRELVELENVVTKKMW